MARRIFKLHALLVALAFLATSACGGAGGTTKGPIHVGAEEYPEEFILGNMYQMLLADAGFEATYQSIGGTAENHQALLAGETDLYPEYTGTALIATLGMQYDSSMTPDDVYNTVKQAYLDQFNVVWLEPTRFNNTYCLAMKKDQATQLGITTLSDLSVQAPDLILATTQECTEREDCLPGLQKAYGGFQFKEVRAMDPGLKYTGLNEGAVDVTTCFGTDGQIAAYDLVVLEDDLRFWPPYPVAPIVRKEVLDKYPEIADILNKVAPLLDGPTMAGLNWEVDGNHKEPDEAAREFLQANNLIK
jgi:osmoprotectant transport system substrate-binding protein